MPQKDKYPATTPSQITTSIQEFASELGGEPQFVKHSPMPFAKPFHCFNNCLMAQDLNLGIPVLGWSIWSTRSLWLTAELHCVLKTGNGIVDITPCPHMSGKVLFVTEGIEINDDNFDIISDKLLSIPPEEMGKSKLIVHHPLVENALVKLTEASLEYHRSQNTDEATWCKRIEQVENLLDAYFATMTQPVKKDLRLRKKMERQRRKRSRQ